MIYLCYGLFELFMHRSINDRVSKIITKIERPHEENIYTGYLGNLIKLAICQFRNPKIQGTLFRRLLHPLKLP